MILFCSSLISSSIFSELSAPVGIEPILAQVEGSGLNTLTNIIDTTKNGDNVCYSSSYDCSSPYYILKRKKCFDDGTFIRCSYYNYKDWPIREDWLNYNCENWPNDRKEECIEANYNGDWNHYNCQDPTSSERQLKWDIEIHCKKEGYSMLIIEVDHCNWQAAFEESGCISKEPENCDPTVQSCSPPDNGGGAGTGGSGCDPTVQSCSTSSPPSDEPYGGLDVKKGVDLTDMSKAITEIYNEVNEVFKEYAGRDGLISSGRDGQHNPGTIHGRGEAIDLSLSGLTADQVNNIVKAIRDRIGTDNYDVINEFTKPPNSKVWTAPHIHIEYQPLSAGGTPGR
jgi:hypothetical protein